MSLVVSGQVTAVATLALAILAFATAVVAGFAFWKQSQEVGTLVAQNKRDIEERRRDQASRVFVYTEISKPHQEQPAKGFVQALTAHVKNTSQQPVYEITVTWPKKFEREDRPDYLTVLMPGERQDFARDRLPNVLPAHRRPLEGIAVEFSDRNQVRWRTTPDGKLEEVEPGTETRDPLLWPRKTGQAGN
jgi:hypothetical protein